VKFILKGKKGERHFAKGLRIFNIILVFTFVRCTRFLSKLFMKEFQIKFLKILYTKKIIFQVNDAEKKVICSDSISYESFPIS